MRRSLQLPRGPNRPALLFHRASSRDYSHKTIQHKPRGPITHKMGEASSYEEWTKESLITRIKELEGTVSTTRPTIPGSKQRNATAAPKPQGKARPVDPSKYSTRFIALKFAYLGKGHGPFEYCPNTLQPSVEEELWKALTKTCLIFPKDPDVVDFSQLEYSKCGRTDVGVSSFGQVISLRVRSNRPLPPAVPPAEAGDPIHDAPQGTTQDAHQDPSGAGLSTADDGISVGAEADFDPVWDEIQYCKVLNRVLPDHIHVYAWCPSPPLGFNSRYSCRQRQYRYFFTQPAFSPVPAQFDTASRPKGGWLDIDAMREAARLFEGEHDWRNFCKLDTSNLTTDYTRRVYEADIREVAESHAALPFLSDAQFRDESTPASETSPKVYSFNVRGAGFLWHQIRHMVGVLFLVGQGLESPSLVSELLNVDKNPQRPAYYMAEEAPLVLWDCLFPNEGDPEGQDALEWIYVGQEGPANKYGGQGIMDSLWARYRATKIDEILAGQLLQRVATQGGVDASVGRISSMRKPGTKVFEGGDTCRYVGRYQPVMKRQRLPSVEETNSKTTKRRGFANSAELRGFLRERKTAAETEDAATREATTGEAAPTEGPGEAISVPM